jgi:putative Holliday junction resolvase
MKIMAIDYGDARTGIAISDPLGMMAGFTTVIHAYTPEKTAAGVKELIAQHRVEELVMGFPKNMDGSEGPRASLYREFAALLEQETGLKPILWDERRTTVDAHRILSQNNVRGKKRKETVDAVAASLILEAYLAFRK